MFFAAEINFVVSKVQQSCPKICGSLLNGQRQSWELYLAMTDSKKVGSRQGNAPLLRIRLEGEGLSKNLFFLVSRALVLNGIGFHTHEDFI